MRRAWLVRPLTLAGVVMLLASRTGSGQAVPRATTLPHDLARTVDAEVRVAMFELASGSELPALSRLERAAELVRRDSSGSGAAERAALHFMLAQSYYRMGLLAPFRREAEASIATGPSRYAALLRPQLVIEAYRAGDYARAATLARDLPPTDASGIGSLVAGLAAYQSGDLPAARSAFQRASSSAGAAWRLCEVHGRHRAAPRGHDASSERRRHARIHRRVGDRAGLRRAEYA